MRACGCGLLELQAAHGCLNALAAPVPGFSALSHGGRTMLPMLCMGAKHRDTEHVMLGWQSGMAQLA